MQRILHAIFVIVLLVGSSWSWLNAQSPTNAVGLDGIDNYVEVGDDPSLDFDAADALFIEFWFRTDENSNLDDLGIVTKMEDVSGATLPTTGLKGYAVSMTGDGAIVASKINQITVTAGPTYSVDNGNIVQTDSDGFDDGVWHHYAIDMSGSNATSYKIWIDGVAQAVSVIANSLSGMSTTNNEALRLGAFVSANNASLSQYANGDLDEVRIWQVARTAEQVRENMYQQLDFPSSDGDLTAYYSFDDLAGSTGTTSDLSPEENEGTLTNDPTIVESLLAFSRASTEFMLNQQNGVRTINNITLDDTPNMFNNSQDIYVTVVNDEPNTRTGIGQLEISDQFYIIDLFENGGDAGFYEVDMTVSCGACADGEDINLNRRPSNSTGVWTPVGGPYTASGGTVTFDGLSMFSQFILSANSVINFSPLAIDFSGNSGYVRVEDDASLDFTTAGDLFVEFWVRTTSTDLIPIVNKLGGQKGYSVSLTGGNTIRMRKGKAFSASLQTIGTAAAAFSDGEWHHIAVDMSGGNSGNYQAWFDGEPLAVTGNGTVLTGQDITNMQPLRIGRISTSTPPDFADAQLDELRIWSMARTTEQVRGNMYQQIPNAAAETSLKAYYTFDDIAGITDMVSDQSGNKNTGTLIDDPTTTESLIDFSAGDTDSDLNEANGIREINGVELDDATAPNANDPFDNSQDIYVTIVQGNPNVVTGITATMVAGRYYIIDVFENAGPIGTYTVDLTFSCGSCVNMTDVSLYRRNNNSIGTWSIVGTVAADGGEVRYEDVPAFGQFILASNATALPVELTYFTARAKDKAIDLYWQTATEINNHGFELQRLEGEKWLKLAFIAGVGNSYVSQDYIFRDEQPLDGMNYYRLKQIDFDGQFTYSDEASAMIDAASSKKFRLFPNPVAHTVTLVLPDEVGEDALIRLYDPTGRLVWSKFARDHQGDIDVNNLPTGLYTIELTDRFEQWRARLVKQ